MVASISCNFNNWIWHYFVNCGTFSPIQRPILVEYFQIDRFLLLDQSFGTNQFGLVVLLSILGDGTYAFFLFTSSPIVIGEKKKNHYCQTKPAQWCYCLIFGTLFDPFICYCCYSSMQYAIHTTIPIVVEQKLIVCCCCYCVF